LALLSLPAASSNRAAGDTGVSDHIAQQLPLLPALSQVDRWVGSFQQQQASTQRGSMRMCWHGRTHRCPSTGACLTASVVYLSSPSLSPRLLQGHACGSHAAGC
jgi:hypothetical protein